MVYLHEDRTDRIPDHELNRSDTAAERTVYAGTALCSAFFIVAAGSYLLEPGKDGFNLMLALGAGGLFLASLVVFFTMIMRDR